MMMYCSFLLVLQLIDVIHFRVQEDELSQAEQANSGVAVENCAE
jgi:hypothetical protein